MKYMLNLRMAVQVYWTVKDRVILSNTLPQTSRPILIRECRMERVTKIVETVTEEMPWSDRKQVQGKPGNARKNQTSQTTEGVHFCSRNGEKLDSTTEGVHFCGRAADRTTISAPRDTPTSDKAPHFQQGEYHNDVATRARIPWLNCLGL